MLGKTQGHWLLWSCIPRSVGVVILSALPGRGRGPGGSEHLSSEHLLMCQASNMVIMVSASSWGLGLSTWCGEAWLACG